MNTTSTKPSSFSAVNVVSAVTSLPSLIIGAPSLFTSTPFTVYSLPTVAPLYSTRSFNLTSELASNTLEPSALFVAVVFNSNLGISTV